MPNPESERYGQYYWLIGVGKTISVDGEVYAHADEIEVTPAGALVLFRTTKVDPDGQYVPTGGKQPMLILPAWAWNLLAAASCLDGRPVATEHRKGQIREEKL
jgi:hypothetical protein